MAPIEIVVSSIKIMTSNFSLETTCDLVVRVRPNGSQSVLDILLEWFFFTLLVKIGKLKINPFSNILIKRLG